MLRISQQLCRGVLCGRQQIAAQCEEEGGA